MSAAFLWALGIPAGSRLWVAATPKDRIVVRAETRNQEWRSYRECSSNRRMDAALETLMLIFSAEEAVAVPDRALFLGASPHPDLCVWPQITGWQPLKPLAAAWDSAGLPRSDNLPDGRWPLVLILPGKSRDETLAWFALARDRLAPGGRIAVAMPNTAGAGRFEKELASATGSVASLQKHKCRAFHAVDDGQWDEGRFNQWRQWAYPRQISGTSFTTCAGIFSSGHVDPGSQLLANHLPSNLSGAVADLGAGWGFLSAVAVARCPLIKRIDLFEADARALACARENLLSERCELGFHWHDVTQGVAGPYDVILMNPPFHTGQVKDVDLGAAFLSCAVAALRRGGRIFLVANRQLPFEALLDAHGLNWRQVAEDPTYKLLFARKR